MKLDIVFGNEIITLPYSAALHLQEAGELDLRVLFALAHDASLRENYQVEKLAVALDAPPREIDAAIAFWRGAGILHATGKGSKARTARADAGQESKDAAKEKADENENKNENKNKEKQPDARQSVRVLRADALPIYTGTECERLLQSRPSLRDVIDEAQRIFEKTFSSSDINLVLALADHLGFSDEYILLLFSHLKDEDKVSMRHLRTTALRFFDEGKTSVEALEGYIEETEKRRSFESAIARLVFGEDRKLSDRQKEYCALWQSYGFEDEVFALAHQRALDREARKVFPYMNGILGNWYNAGVRTVAQIEAFEGERLSGNKKFSSGTAEPTDRSFDSDEFFRIAEDFSKTKAKN